jgi:hypothetical protein
MAQAKAVDSLDEETTKGLEGSDSAITSLIDKLAQGQGRAVFCSSRGNEKSYLMKDGSLSVYTYHFIEALQGAGHSAGDPFVTIASLMNHVGKAVPETSRKLYGTSQQPFQSIEGTNFPIALICGGKGMPRGGWESLQDEAQRYLKGLVGAIARDMLVGGYLSADDVVQILGTAPGQAASCCRPK